MRNRTLWALVSLASAVGCLCVCFRRFDPVETLVVRARAIGGL